MAGRRLRTGSYVVLAAIALSLVVTVVRAQWVGQLFGIVDAHAACVNAAAYVRHPVGGG